MINLKQLEQLAQQVHKTLPKGIRDLGDEMEQKIRQVLQNHFSRMDLVSRNEFDVQTQTLLNVRDKLNQLELRLNTLGKMPQEASTNKATPVNTTMSIVNKKTD